MKRAIFLFDTTGYAAEPFTKAGWETYIIDIKNVGLYAENPRATHVLSWDILEKEQEIIELAKGATFVFGFPPCTDLAVSGAKHFASKAKNNPLFQEEAIHLARSVERIGSAANVPWCLENPVSVLSTKWRKPNFSFHPYYYSGYLPEDDEHPDYPKYIAARDFYSKKTCLWKSTDFHLPPMKLIGKTPTGWNLQTLLLGGKSEKTKRIRSASPRGFFVALQQAWSE
jgi:hypothetical protein